MPISPYDDERYTYADYRSWPNDERWELIEGIPYKLSTAPSTRHQEASWELSRQIDLYGKHRVKEYWIVDPLYNIVTVRLMADNGRYSASTNYEGRGKIEVMVLPELMIDVGKALGGGKNRGMEDGPVLEREFTPGEDTE